MTRKRIEISLIAILIIGMIGYAAIGFALAGDRIASAERTLNNVVSHQNTLNATFADINTQLGALGGGASFDSQQALTLVDKSVANSELATKKINEDDESLHQTERGLSDQRWLMLVGSSGLDRASTRIGHARRALAVARTVAADQTLHGRFWHALYAGLADLANLNNQTATGDLSTARSTLAQMKTDIDGAAQLSSSPGLPADLLNLSIDLQKFVADYGKQLDAEVAGNDAGAAAQRTIVAADVAKIGSYDIDKIGSEISAFFKPMIEKFNSEIAAATG